MGGQGDKMVLLTIYFQRKLYHYWKSSCGVPEHVPVISTMTAQIRPERIWLLPEFGLGFDANLIQLISFEVSDFLFRQEITEIDGRGHWTNKKYTIEHKRLFASVVP